MRSPRPVYALLSAVALTTAVAAGCGSDDGDSSTATTAPVETTTTVADSTTTEPPATTATTEAPTTTTTEPAAAAPTFAELQTASIPAMCLHPATTLVDGEDTSLAENEGVFALRDALPSGEPAHIEGVPSDSGPLTVVVARCNGGGVSWPDAVLFFSAGAEFYGGTFLSAPTVEDAAPATGSWEGAWDAVGASGPGREGVSAIALDRDAVVVTTSVELPDDGACCPSGEAEVRLVPSGGQIEVDGITRTDPGA